MILKCHFIILWWPRKMGKMLSEMRLLLSEREKSPTSIEYMKHLFNWRVCYCKRIMLMLRKRNSKCNYFVGFQVNSLKIKYLIHDLPSRYSRVALVKEFSGNVGNGRANEAKKAEFSYEWSLIFQFFFEYMVKVPN